jgi:membrane protease YdiL (CAAX protease family)
MATGLPSGDQLVLYIVLGIIVLLALVVDFIIFCYWISYKYKEYSFQQAYGTIVTFPPRETDQAPSAELLTPNAKPPMPYTQYPAPNAQFPTPTEFAPPEFDFTQMAVPTDVSADGEHLQDSTIEPDAQHVIEDPQHKSQTVDEIPLTDINVSWSSSPPDPLEDTRPIDTVVIGAAGAIRSPFASTWSLVHPFIGMQAVLLAVNIIAIILLIPIFPMMVTNQDAAMKSPYAMAVIIVTLFIQNVGFVGVSAYFLKGYGTSLSRIGLRTPTRREVVLGLAYGAVLCIVAMLIEKGLDSGARHVVSKQFVDRMGKLTDQLSAGGMFEQIRSVPLQLAFLVAAAIAAPIGEEVFFRGLLYNGLKKRWGVTAGVIVSGICFGLIHLAPVAVLIIIPMGFVLAIVYERTKSLWITILMHAVNNGTQLIIAMVAMKHAAHH